MSPETSEQTSTGKKEEVADKGDWKCSLKERQIYTDEVVKVWKECQEESFWHRALPLSLGSTAITGGLIYSGIWKSSKRFGPYLKLAAAAILGYGVGKASYISTCRKKFQALGLEGGPQFGPWSGRSSFGPFTKSGAEHRSSHHVCQECKETTKATPEEQVNG